MWTNVGSGERYYEARNKNVRPFVHAWLMATFSAPCMVLLPFVIFDGDGVLAALVLPLLVLPWGAVISAPLAFAALVAVAPLYWLLKKRGCRAWQRSRSARWLELSFQGAP